MTVWMIPASQLAGSIFPSLLYLQKQLLWNNWRIIFIPAISWVLQQISDRAWLHEGCPFAFQHSQLCHPLLQFHKCRSFQIIPKNTLYQLCLFRDNLCPAIWIRYPIGKRFCRLIPAIFQSPFLQWLFQLQSIFRQNRIFCPGYTVAWSMIIKNASSS